MIQKERLARYIPELPVRSLAYIIPEKGRAVRKVSRPR